MLLNYKTLNFRLTLKKKKKKLQINHVRAFTSMGV